MVRCIFFIVNTVFSCNSVYAVADASEDLHSGSSNDNSGLYVNGGDVKDLFESDPLGEAWRLYFSEIIQKEDLHENEEQLEEQEQPPRMIVRDFVGGGGSSGGGGASISGIDTRVSALERWRTGHDSWAGGLSNRVSAIENWISNWALPQFNSIWSRLGNLETWKNGHDSWANNLSNRVTSIYNWAIDQFNVQNNRWSDQYRKNNDNWGHWKDQWSKNDDN
ncbi:hypothetical protein, partial [Enterococcus termitis]